ncbi:MAG: rhomboid family intramembrane serine protease [Candidatus Verstraetearchaeota archaeon]|nr:rhomboid family intramembrane serine protease [Candidatus Verstraetearchaeota archaeon]
MIEHERSTRILTAIILLNIIVYLITSYENFFMETSSYWVNMFGFIPSLIGDTQNMYRIFTSMFIHADIFHIFFNMYYLYLFGKPITRVIGGKKLLALYIFSGVAASIFHTAFSYVGGLISYIIPAVGASGAISGVLGAYLIMYPGTYLTMYSPYIFFPFPLRFRVRAEYYLIFWFATQVLYGYAKIAGTVAVFAHAGGFLAGIAILPIILSNVIGRGEEYEYRFDYTYTMPPPIEPRVRRGIGTTSKIILTILIAILLAGNIYAMANPITGDIKAMMIQYTIDGDQYIDYTAVQLPRIESYIREVSTDETRILLSRLTSMNILYDPSKKGAEINMNNIDLNVPVKISLGAASRTYTVKVHVEKLYALYDYDGFIKHCEGTLSTQIIVIQGSLIYVTSDMINYNFKITSQTINLGNIDEYMQIPAFIISIAALIVILRKSQELSLTVGQPREPRLPIPI